MSPHAARAMWRGWRNPASPKLKALGAERQDLMHTGAPQEVLERQFASRHRISSAATSGGWPNSRR